MLLLCAVLPGAGAKVHDLLSLGKTEQQGEVGELLCM